MNHSHYQHQDPRQISLQHLIEQALQLDDQALLTRLELQWVHRFGVHSLPCRFGTAGDESSSAVSDFESEVESGPIAASLEMAEPDSKANSGSGTEPEVSLEVNNVAYLQEDCSDDVGHAVEAATPIAASLEMAEPDSVADTGSETEPEESFGLNRVTSLLKDCLDDVGHAVEPATRAKSPAPSLRPVPAAGPQRLRRWLAPVNQDDLPRAS